MSSRKESAFSKDVKSYIKDKGFYVIKYHGGQFSEIGVPDLLACINGTFVGLELKTGTKATEAQIFDLHKIRESGGISVLLYDTPQWKDIIDTIITASKENQEELFNAAIPIPERRIKSFKD